LRSRSPTFWPLRHFMRPVRHNLILSRVLWH